jgi:chaperonin cofactor prefoldin
LNKGDAKMDNEKLFEFMKKIYSELQATKSEMQNGFNKVNEKMDSIEKRITKVELNQEHANEKIDEVFEALSAHVSKLGQTSLAKGS